MEEKNFSVLSILEDVVSNRSNIKQTLKRNLFKNSNFVQLFSHFNYLNILVLCIEYSIHSIN